MFSLLLLLLLTNSPPIRNVELQLITSCCVSILLRICSSILKYVTFGLNSNAHLFCQMNSLPFVFYTQHDNYTSCCTNQTLQSPQLQTHVGVRSADDDLELRPGIDEDLQRGWFVPVHCVEESIDLQTHHSSQVVSGAQRTERVWDVLLHLEAPR